jgi:hypothetical protein
MPDFLCPEHRLPPTPCDDDAAFIGAGIRTPARVTWGLEKTIRDAT